MLFALPYAIAFHVPFVLVENALRRRGRPGDLSPSAALAATPVGVCVEINQCVGFTIAGLPCWPR